MNKFIGKATKCMITIFICIGMIQTSVVHNEIKAIEAIDATPESAFGITTKGAIYLYKEENNPNKSTIVIPESINGTKVTAIGSSSSGSGVFNGKAIETVILPEGLKEIGMNVFANNKIKEIVIPSTVTIIGNNAFGNNKNLSKLTLSENVKSIGSSAFYGNVLKELNLPDSVESIGANAFKDNQLESVRLPNNESMTLIEPEVFGFNRIKTLEIPANIKSIGDSSFKNNLITELKILGNDVEIGNSAFAYNEFESLNLSDGVISLGESAFANNGNLSNITLSKNLKTIGDHAFSTCAILDFELPDSVETIGKESFYSQYAKPGAVAHKQDNRWTLDFKKDFPSIDVSSVVVNSWAGGISNLRLDDTKILFEESISEGELLNNWVVFSHKVRNAKSNGTPDFYAEVKIVDYYIRSLTYQVTFKDADGATIKSDAVVKNSAAIAPSENPKTNDPSKEFARWNQDFSSVTDEMTISPVFDTKKLKVHFNHDGKETILDSEVLYDTMVGRPSEPTKEGYTFAGWYSDSTLNTEWNFGSNKVTSDITLYAKWITNKYDVRFEENGGSAQADIKLDYNSKIAQPTEVKKAGYTLEGWYTDNTFHTKWDFDIDKVKTDTTLYAKWVINQYNVVFEENGGSAQADVKLDYNSKITKPTDVKRAGYTFAGWYSDSTLKTEWNFDDGKVEKDMTLYAKWIGNEYTVTFKSEKGVITSPNRKVTYGQEYGTLEEPVNTNATFAGWYTEKYGKGIKRNASDIVEIQEDETLYAYWVNDFFEEEKGNILFDEKQDDRYNLIIEEEEKDIVKLKDNLKGIYDIYFVLNDNRIAINDAKMTITLKLKKEEQGFKNYKVAYINSEGEVVEEYIPILSTSKEEITFEVNHLSLYAIYAWDDSNIENSITENTGKIEKQSPKTGHHNNVQGYTFLALLSMITIVVTKKKKAKRKNI